MIAVLQRVSRADVVVDGETVGACREGLCVLLGVAKGDTEADADALAHMNRSFHSTIEHLSDKRRILSVIDSQEEYIIRFSAVTIASIVRRSNAHQEHHQMVELLEKRDLESLKVLMHNHLEESKETCLAAVSQNRVK